MGFREAFTGVFSFLRSGSQSETRIAQYIVREHRRGRPLGEIVDDHYVTNRLTREQIGRILERPEVVHAIGEDTISAELS